MGVQRGDISDTPTAPFGKAETKYVTPNPLVDWIVIEQVNISPENYRPIPYGSPHPDYDNNGLVLSWQGPIKAGNNQVKVIRLYTAETGGPENWWNYATHYANDVNNAPIYIRSYIVLRSAYEPLAKLSPLTSVIRLRVTNGGSGYTTVPTVALTGGAGSGATARAIMSPDGDEVIGLELVTEGIGYTTAPAVGFSGGGGSGAAATAYIQPATALLVKEETAKIDDQQLASLFIRVNRIYETLPGPFLVWDVYNDERGSVQRRTQSIAAVGNEAPSYTRNAGVVTKLTYEPRGDSAIVLTKIEETWIDIIVDDQQVTSEFGGGVLDKTERRDEPGAQTPDQGFLVVDSVLDTKHPHEQVKLTRKLSPDSTTPVLELVLQGAGFSSAPAVGFSGGTGSGATAHSVLGFGLASIAVNNGGSGYYSPPAVGFSGGGGGGAFATAALGYTVQECLMTNRGSGYSSTPSVSITGDGSGATATAVRGFGVSSISLSDYGDDYTDVPDVVIAGSGDGAVAKAIMGYKLDTIDLGVPGFGYLTAPDVVITGDGHDAEAIAVLAQGLVAGDMTDSGTGYDSDGPDITIDPPETGGTQATAEPDMLTEEGVASIAVGAGGSGYSSPPSIFIDPPSFGGQLATAHAVLAGDVVTSIVVDDPGTGYESTPDVFITGGGGTGATGTATLNALTTFIVTGIYFLVNGDGYETVPDMAFSGGGGSGAAGTVDLDSGDTIARIVIVDPGSGYSTTPAIAITGSGEGAEATVTLDTSVMQVNRIELLAAGHGYTSTPTITLPGSGSPAVATATLLTTGEIVSITVTAPGSGYTTASVSITGGSGSGATAEVLLSPTGSVKSITVRNAGLFKTLPSVVFAGGGGGSGAVATGTLASTGSVVELVLDTPGTYSVAPTVTFTGSHSIAATAIYHLGDALWPTLFGYDTDAVHGIVVNNYRTVVPAGLAHPGRGNFVDLKVHDKWKSIQITSRVDLNTLPLPESWPTTRRFDLPPTLLSIEGAWSDTSSKFAAGLASKAEVSVGSGSSGRIIVKGSTGFRGYAKARVERLWFFGPPPEEAIPVPLKIIASSGTAVINQFDASTNYTKLDDGGQAIGDNSRVDVVATDIRDHLVGNFALLNSSHLSPARSAIAVSGGGSFAAAFAYGKLCTIQVDIPVSDPRPEQLYSGRSVVVFAEPEKWRFGVWILEIVRVTLP